MTSIVLIDKNSSLKQTKVKNLAKDTLYKKCGFKVSGGFALRTVWKVKIEDTKMNIEMWSRDHGKAGTENKYDFPPPVDTALYFGTCVVVQVDDDGALIDLSVSMWKKIYEKLFGGFEDIGDEDDDDDSEDELASIPKEMKTKSGYLKDGFVVDDSGDADDVESDSNDADSDDDIHDDDNDGVSVGDVLSINEDDDDDDDDDEDDDDSNVGSELCEDTYLYSSDEN
tara:strand:+ start:344 stop:1021 length:678 start_codon:yes stop_codon:yes gene_type:complete